MVVYGEMETTVSKRFLTKMTLNSKMSVFWDVTPCSLVETNRRFTCAYCLHRPGDKAVRTSETSVSFYQTSRRNIPEDRHLTSFRFVFWNVLPCKKLSTDVSEVRAASIITAVHPRRQF
jgi:hypothetical protein